MLHKKLLTLFAIAGLILFIGSIGFVFYRASAFPSTSSANHVLGLQDLNSVNQSQVCKITWQVVSYPKSMMEGDGQPFIVSVNNSCSFKVQADFYLQTSSFDVSRPDWMFPLNSGTSQSISWLLTAHKTGAVLVSAMFYPPDVGDRIVYKNSEMDTISVTTTLGLNPQLLQLLPYLGTFLGPMLTVPWWYEQWQKHREKKQAEAAEAASAPKSHPAKKRDHARSHR